MSMCSAGGGESVSGGATYAPEIDTPAPDRGLRGAPSMSRRGGNTRPCRQSQRATGVGRIQKTGRKESFEHPCPTVLFGTLASLVPAIAAKSTSAFAASQGDFIQSIESP